MSDHLKGSERCEPRNRLSGDEISKMPHRKLVAEELSQLLSTLSHPDRIRLLQELRTGERDVTGLREALQISPSRLSQHLTLLKGMHLIKERKCGRQVFYHLLQPGVAEWLMQGTEFLQHESQRLHDVLQALEKMSSGS